MRAMIATIAMRARISAYSARPWPSSSFRKEAMRAVRYVMRGLDLLSTKAPRFPEGCATLWSASERVNRAGSPGGAAGKPAFRMAFRAPEPSPEAPLRVVATGAAVGVAAGSHLANHPPRD